MDLKSMLNNDATAQRPPSIHTPHSSYDTRANENTVPPESHSRSQSQSHSQSSRPLPYPPPLQPVDSRAQAPGGYFGLQSPHPNHLNSASTHASTPSVGPHSAYARSPGAQSQVYTPRDSGGPPGAYNHSFVPSPSTLSVNQPPTPGSAYQHQNHTPLSAHSQSGHLNTFVQAHSPRGANPTNGQLRQASPNTPHAYPHPATPLGPPANYNKISPQTQRPPSQGIEQHYRKTSYGSVGSAQGRDLNAGPQQAHERSDSVQRQSIPDLERVKERERSVSISPKTIPQPSPYRQMSISSQAGSQGRPSIQSPPETRSMSNISDVQSIVNPSSHEVKLEYQQTPTPRSSAIPEQQPISSRGPSIKQETPDVSSPAPPSNLKRNASFMSSDQAQPRKRPRRDDVPLFARNARQKALRLGTGGKSKHAKQGPSGRPPVQQPQQVPQTRPSQQVIASQPVQIERDAPEPTNGRPPPPTEFRWEPSIANITPYEDVTRRVCDWIFSKIGAAIPPSGGAMFEIEAKIGEIYDFDAGQRLSLPVTTETVFDKSRWNRTKFESSMNMEQHMLLNKYLNDLTQNAFLQAQKGERQEILYDHPHEVDEFFELTLEGRQNLNPSIIEYLTQSNKPRVRQTRDRNTGQLKAQIIKTRIADMEIYNPSTDFDCRISISIESPWEGNPNWLVPMGEGNEGRQKDRMSYRHMAYQVDLTQVTYENQAKMTHELEVEISTEQIRRELDNLRCERPSKYEDLVKGLIDNVRLLCRKGSVGGPKRG